MQTKKIAAALLAPFALAACNTIPQYTPAPNEKQTTVRLLGWGKPYMCRKGEMFSLPLVEDKGNYKTQVPTGERIGIMNYISVQGYQVVSHCTARASVVPRDGVTLIVNSILPEAGKCGLDVVREDESKETGVAPEPSFGGFTC